MNKTPATSRPNLQLALGTVSFAICFAAWGLISAFAPRFRETFHLTATQTAFLVAVPVLLGALLRIVTGMLADRFGGRAIFSLLMIVVAVPACLVPLVPSYRILLYVAFFLGMAGSSFAVGVGFVSRWFPPEKQGGALGIYGLGNIGQSAAVFLGPVLAMAMLSGTVPNNRKSTGGILASNRDSFAFSISVDILSTNAIGLNIRSINVTGNRSIQAKSSIVFSSIACESLNGSMFDSVMM